MAVIDMQTMRYINLLDRNSGVKTTKCFLYNNSIIFAVPKEMLSRAIGQQASNIRNIQEQIGKKIRVIEESSGSESMQKFISDIVSPVSFKSVEVKDRIIILTAGSQSKAALIGRNRRRQEELQKIVKDTYGMDLRIL
jgi:NusA-like KH domain protein